MKQSTYYFVSILSSIVVLFFLMFCVFELSLGTSILLSSVIGSLMSIGFGIFSQYLIPEGHIVEK